MNYLTVPDSTLKLVDGNVVMLDRFPGMKWILHNGWYNYNGRQYSGWYFTSIPSQTILPVSNQDLRMITLVSSKSNDVGPDYPAPPPGPGCPCGPDHPPYPPIPPYPPVPPYPPEPERPAFFSERLKKQLDSAFISVATLKKRDELDTTKLPDGKIVRVNSVDGEPKYYVWSTFNDHWEDFDIVLQPSLDEQLEKYYTSEEVDKYLDEVGNKIEEVSQALEQTSEQLQKNIDSVDDKVSELSKSTQEQVQELQKEIEYLQKEIDEHDGEYESVIERIIAIEAAIFDIQKISKLLSSNTVLVSDEGRIIDSGVAIGDGEIEETAQYASETTLATEKAVAKKVEDSQPKWASF